MKEDFRIFAVQRAMLHPCRTICPSLRLILLRACCHCLRHEFDIILTIVSFKLFVTVTLSVASGGDDR